MGWTIQGSNPDRDNTFSHIQNDQRALGSSKPPI